MKSRVVFVFLLFGFLLPANVLAETHSVTWNPTVLEQMVWKGEAEEVTVSFITSTRLENVDVWISQKLRPILTVEPSHFGILETDTLHEVRLRFSAPSDVQPQSYNGHIQLIIGSEPYAGALTLVLDVRDAREEIRAILNRFSTALILNDVEIAEELFADDIHKEDPFPWDSATPESKRRLGKLLIRGAKLPESIETDQKTVPIRVEILHEDGSVSYGTMFVVKGENGEWKIGEWPVLSIGTTW